nr:hypothetical protein [Tanacetum cinerariifolium]
KLLEDLHIINEELVEYISSLSWNRPIFYSNDEEHSVQYKEYLENSTNEITASNFNQEKEEPPQNSDIRQLIREECCIECQPMDQNIDSSGFDQILTPQYPVIHHPSQEISEEVLQAKGNLMKSIQTFLEKFNCIPFGEKPKVLEECCIEVCEKQKKNMEDTLLELLKVCQQKEFYCMHNTVDDLIESARNSKLLLINLRSQRLDKKKQEVKDIVEQLTERGTRNAKSLQNFRVKQSSISLNNTSQISLVHAIAPVLPTKKPKYSLSMGYEHPSTIPETESDEVIKSSVEKLVPIPSECEVTSNNERDCDVPVCEDSSTFDVCEDHYEILSDSNNDDISSDDDAFEDIEYVEASPLDSELVS